MPRTHYFMRKLFYSFLAALTCCLPQISLAQISMNDKDPNYSESWKKITQFENEGLPKSALDLTEAVYADAASKKLYAQVLKALVHKMKFIDYKEENSFIKNLNFLKEEIQKQPEPVKQILQSVLASLYWQYYENNRYRFSNRSEVKELDQWNIETWSLEKIVEETMAFYELSLSNEAMLKSIDLSAYKEILVGSNELGRQYRPTLYDFLAHRALDFYLNEESSLPQPAYAFHVNDERLLSTNAEFLAIEFKTLDTYSLKFKGVLLFQKILNFHKNDSNPEAFLDVEFKRLKYFYDQCTLSNKEILFKKRMEELKLSYANSPYANMAVYHLAQILLANARLYAPLQGDEHKWEAKQALELCKEYSTRFPDFYATKMLLNTINDIQYKEMDLVTEQAVPSASSLLLKLSFRNISETHYRIIPTTRDEIKNVRNKWRNDYSVDREKMFIEHYVKKSFDKSGSFVLPNDGDFQQHSTELKLDALPLGNYMILFSNTSNFSSEANKLAYAIISVTDIAYLSRSKNDGSTEIFVLDRKTGKALPGVKMDMYWNVYNYKTYVYEQVKGATYTSGEDGYCLIPFMNKDNRTFLLRFYKEKDEFYTIGIDDYDHSTFSQYVRSGDHYNQTESVIFTDRAIYRPGQTVYFKGLVYSYNTNSLDNTLLKNLPVTVSFYDANGESIHSVSLTTNEFGTYQGTFIAPLKGLTGAMHIEDAYSEKYINVEEYKRPKFETTFEPVKGSFRLEETISVKGKAMAYSGAAIDGAKVQYRVVRRAEFPYWWWCWYRSYPTSPEMQLTIGETKTQADGSFVIDFKAIPDYAVSKNSDPTFNYTVYADVTDINGETRSGEITVNVSYKALLVSTNFGNLDLAKIEKDKFKIYTTNLSGEHENASVQVRIEKLKNPDQCFRKKYWTPSDIYLIPEKEYRASFPFDEYKNESNEAFWKTENVVFDKVFNTATDKDFGIDQLKKWAPGKYKLTLSSKDKFGVEVKNIQYIEVANTASGILTVPNALQTYTLKRTYEPGEQAELFLGTSYRGASVLVEWIVRDGVRSRKWYTINASSQKITFPVTEEDRGNYHISVTMIHANRKYGEQVQVNIPFTNRELNVSYETFRDKLQPGASDEWRLKISGSKADMVNAELLASMYDASLDVFLPHDWNANFNRYNYSYYAWESRNCFDDRNFKGYMLSWQPNRGVWVNVPTYDQLNWFGYNYYAYAYNYRKKSRSRIGGVERSTNNVAMACPKMDMDEGAEMEESDKMMVSNEERSLSLDSPGATDDEKKQKPEEKKETKKSESGVQVRKNFNETAFFFPNLMTNEKGEIILKFTMPESLTRWKFMGFAHTQDLKFGFTEKFIVTQKELMVVPNQPRFFRENDNMAFSVKVNTLSDKTLTGEVSLEFFDALTMRPINKDLQMDKTAVPFKLEAGRSQNFEWMIKIPEGIQAITYRVIAKAGQFSDGEEMTLPVVTNRMLVTESMPLPIKGKQQKIFTLDKLVNSGSSTTMKNHRFTLEFTSNPAWYAVQALPYLMQYPYECVEQTFSRYYANSIATHIANSNPRIKSVFDTWKNIQPDALLSNLEKNQELKSALLEETPWVFEAKDESQRKRMVAVLFDLNRMSDELETALDKVMKAQTPNGGFSWFPGFPEDRYMTQHIVSGMGHLKVMGVKNPSNEDRVNNMIREAVQYLDRKIAQDYDELKRLAAAKKIKMEDNHLSYLAIHYLYARFYFNDIIMSPLTKAAVDYFIGQEKKYWTSFNLYTQGMMALSLHRYGDKETPAKMIRSFDERKLVSEEMGMYWKYNAGYYWYEAPIETQALMIEVYDEVANDLKTVEELKVWLLKNKQTNDWKTTRATTEACYALLRRGTDVLASTKMVEVKVGGMKYDPTTDPENKVEAGTGYFKKAWTASEIKPEFGKIEVTKTDDGVAWGAVYWQYFEQLDKITVAKTNLQIKKQLFLVTKGDRGEVLVPINDKNTLKVGDMVKVRVEIYNDRPMEYVHLKDMRAAAFEPVNTLSTHKYQDGLWYYESTKDVATNFFISYLPKGTFVFEYPLRVAQKGNFSNGITTMQCMYAPEFSSHSEGVRVEVKE